MQEKAPAGRLFPALHARGRSTTCFIWSGGASRPRGCGRCARSLETRTRSASVQCSPETCRTRRNGRVPLRLTGWTRKILARLPTPRNGRLSLPQAAGPPHVSCGPCASQQTRSRGVCERQHVKAHMAQIFRPRADAIARVVLVALAVVPVLLVGLGYTIMRSPYVTQQNVTREQPVPFSHEHHVGQTRGRLPLLPYLGRDSALRRNSADRDLHDLPFADLDQRRHACAGAHEPRREPPVALAARPQPAGLRLFRPQRPCRERRRLLDLPRASGRDAADAAGGAAHHGLVPRLPPQPRAEPAPARRCLRHGLDAAEGPGRTGRAAAAGPTTSTPST